MNSVSNTSLCRQMFEKNSSLSTKSWIYFIRGRLKSGWAVTCWAQCRLSLTSCSSVLRQFEHWSFLPWMAFSKIQNLKKLAAFLWISIELATSHRKLSWERNLLNCSSTQSVNRGVSLVQNDETKNRELLKCLLAYELLHFVLTL